MSGLFSCVHPSLPGSFPLQETPQAPVGTLVHQLMPTGRQGTSKCAARCASPAQWDIHFMALQRGSAFPMGRGRVGSRSANVRKIFKLSLLYYVMYETVGEEGRGVREKQHTLFSIKLGTVEVSTLSSFCVYVHMTQ